MVRPSPRSMACMNSTSSSSASSSAVADRRSCRRGHAVTDAQWIVHRPFGSPPPASTSAIPPRPASCRPRGLLADGLLLVGQPPRSRPRQRPPFHRCEALSSRHLVPAMRRPTSVWAQVRPLDVDLLRRIVGNFRPTASAAGPWISSPDAAGPTGVVDKTRDRQGAVLASSLRSGWAISAALRAPTVAGSESAVHRFSMRQAPPVGRPP